MIEHKSITSFVWVSVGLQVFYDVDIEPEHEVRRRSVDQPLRIHLYFDDSINQLPRSHSQLIKVSMNFHYQHCDTELYTCLLRVTKTVCCVSQACMLCVTDLYTVCQCHIPVLCKICVTNLHAACHIDVCSASQTCMLCHKPVCCVSQNCIVYAVTLCVIGLYVVSQSCISVCYMFHSQTCMYTCMLHDSKTCHTCRPVCCVLTVTPTDLYAVCVHCHTYRPVCCVTDLYVVC